jgi:hypothetical protein
MKLCRNYYFMGCDAAHFGRQTLSAEPIEIYSATTQNVTAVFALKALKMFVTGHGGLLLSTSVSYSEVLYSILGHKTGHFEVCRGFVILWRPTTEEGLKLSHEHFFPRLLQSLITKHPII